MELLNAFKQDLLQGKEHASKITVKNYLADVRKFITWYENTHSVAFTPPMITPDVLHQYQKHLVEPRNEQTALPSPSSVKRYQSSLRKFFRHLTATHVISTNPFEIAVATPTAPADPWQIDQFKHYLHTSHASTLTIKNYVTDVRQFKEWLAQVTPKISDGSTGGKLGKQIDSLIIEEYKNRLIHNAGLSPVSINRKLSALRKYAHWAYENNILMETPPNVERISLPKHAHKNDFVPQAHSDELPLESLQHLTPPLTESELDEQAYSRFAPIRLMQKSRKLLVYAFDAALLNPIVECIDQAKYIYWKLRGRKVFEPIHEMVGQPNAKTQTHTIAHTSGTKRHHTATTSRLDLLIRNKAAKGIISMRNIPKSVYAPLAISIKHFSWHQKALYHLMHTRPNWYKKYHSYAVTHYFHFALLLIFTITAGFSVYKTFFDAPRKQGPVLASLPASPPKLLSFKGKLTDATSTPITAATPLRFAIYKSPTATGSALVWQEVQDVDPKEDGSFAVFLGQKAGLKQEVFTENSGLYLGISVANGKELLPRHQLPTVSYAANAKTLEGMKAITQSDAGTENVILALDSSGDLTIGGSASPTFQATGGEFTLAGQALTLTTNEKSNGNIQLRPDGSGIIDMQKPIQNTTEYSKTPGAEGAVEIEDMLAVIAKSSSQSALLIEQNSTGSLISARSHGFAKFTVDGYGNGTFASNVGINGNYLMTTSTTFNLFDSNVLNLTIGKSATSLSLGATTGITTINNGLQALGGISIPSGKSLTLAGFTPGAIPFIDSTRQLAYDNTGLFWDAATKRMGLGTTTPSYRLDVSDMRPSSAVAQISNTETSTDADGLIIKLGNAAGTVATTNTFLSFQTAGLGVVGSIRGNGANGITLQQNGIADFAEHFRKDPTQDIPFGAIVCMTDAGTVAPCTTEGDSIVGVTSQHPAFLAGEDLGRGSIPVGLTGLVKTAVSSRNGAILPGDMITSSSTQGVGVKAVKSGMVVGRAVDGYTNADPNAVGYVLLSIHTTWYAPTVTLNNHGTLGEETATPTTTSELEKITYTIIENIQRGTLRVQKLSTQSLEMATENIIISGQTIREYITSVIEDLQKGRPVLAALANEPENRELLTPLASGSAIALLLSDDTLTIRNGNDASSSAVATIDNQGNASFSGTLQSHDLLTNDATISGTLRAGKLIADDVELSENALSRIARLASQYASPAGTITNSTTTETNASSSGATATPSATPMPELSPTPPAIASPAAFITAATTVHPVASFVDVATFSAQLAYVPNLQADFATFNQGIVSLGPSSMTALGITEELRIGKTLMLADNAINTIGTDLELQPLRQGNLSVMGGLVAIDTEGNLRVEGNAYFAKDVHVDGNLTASNITARSGEDIRFGLASGEATLDPKLSVHNQSGTNVLSINQLGDVIASGTGQFVNIAADALKIIRGAQADTSLTETVANGSAGSTVITANETERTVFTPFVKRDSLIYITATSNTHGVLPYIARQTEEDAGRSIKGSFTIQIPNRVTKDIKINWWIVN